MLGRIALLEGLSAQDLRSWARLHGCLLVGVLDFNFFGFYSLYMIFSLTVELSGGNKKSPRLCGYRIRTQDYSVEAP